MIKYRREVYHLNETKPVDGKMETLSTPIPLFFVKGTEIRFEKN